MEEAAYEGFVFSCQMKTSNAQPIAKYFSVKVKRLELFSNQFKVITIRDQTISVLFDIQKGEQQILRLVNACVSHEMRNPINSILATNLKLQESARELQELLAAILESETQRPTAAQQSKIEELTGSMTEVSNDQESSTKLLNFYVADLLCLA